MPHTHTEGSMGVSPGQDTHTARMTGARYGQISQFFASQLLASSLLFARDADCSEYQDRTREFASRLKNECKSSSPKELHEHLNNASISKDSLTLLASCPNEFESLFPFHWKTVHYRLISNSRKSIRELNKKLANVDKSDSIRETQDLRKAAHPLIASLVLSCTEALCFYGSLMKALCTCYGLEARSALPVIQDVIDGLNTLLPQDSALVQFAGTLEMSQVLSSIQAERLAALLSRGCIFVGDAVRYVVQNVKPEMHENVMYSSYGLHGVAERFTMGNTIRMYCLAMRLCPGSGNPHNQIAAISLSLKQEWAAIVSYIRAIDVTDSPFSSAIENNGLLRAKVRNRYMKDHNVRAEMGRWSGGSATASGSVGSVKLVDWLAFLKSWKVFTRRYLHLEDRSASASTSESPVALKAAIELRIAYMCGILITNSSVEDVPVLETETMSLLYTAGLPGKDRSLPLTPRELFRSWYALQSATSMHLNKRCQQGRVPVPWTPVAAHSMHVVYTLSAFVLEYVRNFFRMSRRCSGPGSPSKMEEYFCHMMVIGVVNMATVLRSHVVQALEADSRTAQLIKDAYTHSDCNTTDDPYHVHVCHVGLTKLIHRLDDRLDELKGHYPVADSADADRFMLSVTDEVPMEMKLPWLCASCESGSRDSCKMACKDNDHIMRIWSDEHRGSKALADMEDRALPLLFQDSIPSRCTRKDMSAEEWTALAMKTAGQQLEAYGGYAERVQMRVSVAGERVVIGSETELVSAKNANVGEQSTLTRSDIASDDGEANHGPQTYRDIIRSDCSSDGCFDSIGTQDSRVTQDSVDTQASSVGNSGVSSQNMQRDAEEDCLTEERLSRPHEIVRSVVARIDNRSPPAYLVAATNGARAAAYQAAAADRGQSDCPNPLAVVTSGRLETSPTSLLCPPSVGDLEAGNVLPQTYFERAEPHRAAMQDGIPIDLPTTSRAFDDAVGARITNEDRLARLPSELRSVADYFDIRHPSAHLPVSTRGARAAAYQAAADRRQSNCPNPLAIVTRGGLAYSPANLLCLPGTGDLQAGNVLPPTYLNGVEPHGAAMQDGIPIDLPTTSRAFDDAVGARITNEDRLARLASELYPVADNFDSRHPAAHLAVVTHGARAAAFVATAVRGQSSGHNPFAVVRSSVEETSDPGLLGAPSIRECDEENSLPQAYAEGTVPLGAEWEEPIRVELSTTCRVLTDTRSAPR